MLFLPIVNIHNVLACLVLERTEHQLDDHQPEEQRRGKSIEEHLLTANVFVDITLAVGIRVWVASVNFSKTFARVHWPALLTTLLERHLRTHGLDDFDGMRRASWREQRIDFCCQ